MCDLGISPEEFNPRILYVLKKKNNSQSPATYHCHDHITIVYIISGSCTYRINDELFPVKKGDVIICNPGVYHGFAIPEDEEITEFHIGITNIKIDPMPQNCLISESSSPVITMIKYEQDFFKCYSDITTVQERHEPGTELILKALVMKLIVILLKETHFIEKSGSACLYNLEYYDRTDLVNSIIKYISENYSTNISLDKIAKNMYLSPVYISRIFKEETGDSPINYLINVRLNKAHELLTEGRLSIASIAHDVGYEDAYYFSKLYKKHFGCPPSAELVKDKEKSKVAVTK
jgi:AraC-like DNA-binding protein